MQIRAKTNRGSFASTSTPQIKIVETDHGITAQGANPAELLMALDARQVMPLFGDSILDRGVPMSPLND